MDDLVSDFALEAAESLAGLQRGLAALSTRRDAAAVGEMRRRLHALKGLCGFVGLARTEAIAHAAEAMLEGFEDREAQPSFRELALLGDALHRIAELIAFFAYDHIEPRGADAELVEALEGVSAPAPSHAEAVRSDRRGPDPWRGLDHLARALGDRLGKRIDLVVGGDNLRVQRGAAAPLRSALIALVRNACDHGVETPAERRAVGKPAAALLHLTVRRTANGAAIDLVDDGRGVDPERVRQRARSLARPPEALDGLTAAAVQALVFTPGLSTAQDVTTVSGRGLGLEIVRREVEALGGEVEMSSTPGQGARFTLHLPKSVLAAPAQRRLAAA